MYLGALQYEGSNNFELKEPYIVNLRFKRAHLLQELKEALENITTFRKDKNDGPEINLSAESIAFKFKTLNPEVEETIDEIVDALSLR